MSRLGVRLRDGGRAFALTARRPSLVRAQLAFGASWAAEWAFTVALSIVAFRDGGAEAVGVVTAVRLVPAAALAPVLSSAADRWSRDAFLVVISLARAAATAGAAAVLAGDGPAIAVYALAVASTVAFTPFRAAHSALLPELCATTEELTSSNVVRGMLDALGVVLGPLAAAALLDATEVWVVFAAAAGAAGGAALLLVALPYERSTAPPPPRPPVLRATAEGLRAIVADRDVVVLNALAAVQTFLRGCLNVFVVVVAIDLLDAGEPGVGVLGGAVGVGAVLGSFGSTMLVGSRRLSQWVGVAVVLWGAPIALLAAISQEWWALLMLAAIGVGNSLLDVALFTNLTRLVPDDVLGRAFGAFESLVAISVALGSVVAAVAVDGLGLRPALVVLGATGPLASAVCWAALRSTDRSLAVRQEEIDVLQRVPMLRALPVAAIERLARNLERRPFLAGDVLVREGTVGQGYYVLGEGLVEVRAAGEHVRRLGPGEGFGEIALLRDVPRTATVTAIEDGAAYRLDRRDFVPAVTGYAGAATTSAAVVDRYLDQNNRSSARSTPRSSS